MNDFYQIRRSLADCQVRINSLRSKREAACNNFYSAAMIQNREMMDAARLAAQTSLDAELDEVVTQTMLLTQLIEKSSGL